MREVGRRWHSQWDINVAARTKDWFAAGSVIWGAILADRFRPVAVIRPYGLIADIPVAMIGRLLEVSWTDPDSTIKYIQTPFLTACMSNRLILLIFPS